ncbi:hypothetical protein OAN81_06620 [Paracoccaceae bacterium]|nr:hypothetical protein [Paracoccaceae bacterium]
MNNFKFPKYLLMIRGISILLTAIIILVANAFLNDDQFIDYTYAIISAAIGSSIISTILTPYAVRYFNSEKFDFTKSLNHRSIIMLFVFSCFITFFIILSASSKTTFFPLYSLAGAEFFLNLILMLQRTNGQVLQEALYLTYRSFFDLGCLILLYFFNEFISFSIFLLACAIFRIILLTVEFNILKCFFIAFIQKKTGSWFLGFSLTHIKLILISLITRFDALILPTIVDPMLLRDLANLTRIYSLLIQLQSSLFNKQIQYLFGSGSQMKVLAKTSKSGAWAGKIFIVLAPFYIILFNLLPYIHASDFGIAPLSAVAIYLVVISEAYLGPVFLVRNVLEIPLSLLEFLLWILLWTSFTYLCIAYSYPIVIAFLSNFIMKIVAKKFIPA